MILVVGLSPAWQRTIELLDFKTGAVNRVSRVIETASGKVINVARVASLLGAKVKVLTVQGGELGKKVIYSLQKSKIQIEAVPVSAETRICQTLLSHSQATEIVEEAGRFKINGD